MACRHTNATVEFYKKYVVPSLNIECVSAIMWICITFRFQQYISKIRNIVMFTRQKTKFEYSGLLSDGTYNRHFTLTLHHKYFVEQNRNQVATIFSLTPNFQKNYTNAGVAGPTSPTCGYLPASLGRRWKKTSNGSPPNTRPSQPPNQHKKKRTTSPSP